MFLNAEVFVVDPSAECQAEAIRLGAAEAMSSLGELPDVKGIVVATPPSTHAEVVGEALGRDTPLFVETPFTTDAITAASLAGAAPDSLFVMHLWRYHTGVEMLAALHASEELGKTEWLRLFRTNWNNRHPELDATWSLLPHDLSIVQEILGAIPPPIFAVAEQNLGAVTGMVAVLGDLPRVVIENSTRYSDNRTEVRLHCSQGVAVLPDIGSLHIEVTREHTDADSPVPEPERRTFSPEQPLTSELKAFIEHVRHKRTRKPRSSAEEGLAVVETIARIRELAGME